jgi:hypothetical protein
MEKTKGAAKRILPFVKSFDLSSLEPGASFCRALLLSNFSAIVDLPSQGLSPFGACLDLGHCPRPPAKTKHGCNGGRPLIPSNADQSRDPREGPLVLLRTHPFRTDEGRRFSARDRRNQGPTEGVSPELRGCRWPRGVPGVDKGHVEDFQ